MKKRNAFTTVNLATGDAIAHGQRIPRPKMGKESDWLDPSNNFTGDTPVEWEGIGWFPEYEDRVVLDAGQVYADPVWQSPDMVNNRVVLLYEGRERSTEEIEQKKTQLKQSVNQERDRRWRGTVNCDLAGDGSLVIPADVRNDTDLRNIQAVTTAAQVIAGTPDAVLKFRDANDVTHNLSPEEVIALGLIVQAHVQSFYEKAWVLKDSIDSMTSVELDAIDVRNNSHWGITNVSSSADSI